MGGHNNKRATIAHIQDSFLSSPHAKAERLKRVRNFANLSREEFCADGGVNLTTLISWEVGRFGGLSRKGATNVIARVAKEGVFVTLEWLLYEVGVGPEVRADYKKLGVPQQKVAGNLELVTLETRFIEELMLFKKLNKNAIDFIIDDDTMLPHYRAGECVAGVKRFQDKIKSLVSYDCIVQTIDGRILMRNLQHGPRANSYNLVPTHLQTKVKNALVYDVELASAAPILWHRRKEPKY